MPPLITILPETSRAPYPITWTEPDALFRKLPAHLGRMALFAVTIVEAHRSLHPIWVFRYRGRRINTMNNNGWQHARRKAGLPLVRIDDLRHSFGARLRAAGVSAEDRAALLGHANHSMAGH